jgi:hypothetical protein
MGCGMILALFFSHPVVFVTSEGELLTTILSCTSLGVIVTAAYQARKHVKRWAAAHECHVDGCKRHQWKEHIEPDGTKLVLCRTHHPLGGQVITPEQVLAGHAINIRAKEKQL